MGNKPRIRFKGFTEDWEQRKFSEITYLSGIKNKENKPYESYSISNEFGFIPQNEQFENGGTMKTADKSMYYIVTQNSFAYNPARINVGSIGYYDKPDNVIVSSLYEVFKTTEIVNDKFLWHWFKSNQFNHLIEKYQEGGVRLYFYYDKLCKGTIELPTIDEQNKISNLLESLDLYITLHQCKLEKLKLTKKALLQKLFPKNGKHIPEIRFKGFTDAWEQRKLSDITEVIMGQSPSSRNYTDNPNDSILVQGNADLKDGKVVPRLWTKEITKTIDKDGIILTVRAPVGDVAKTDYKVVLGRGVAGIKGNDYIYQFLQKLQNDRYWVTLSSGSTFESINSKDIKDLIINIPSKEEQTKISTLLNNVNSIITLHQCKLERLQEVKKGLLQKMFV